MNEEIQKSQAVRLVDIFFLGPFMIYVAAKRLRGPERAILLTSGVLTILYNGRNYLDNQNRPR